VGGVGAEGNGADLLQGQQPAPPCAPPRTPPRQRWIFAEPHPAEAAALSKAARLPQVLAELLVARGVVQPAEAFTFLNPELAHLHDPQLMLGMNAAVARLEQAIARREPVLLYGDYDVDGATAVVLLKTAIEMLGGIALAMAGDIAERTLIPRAPKGREDPSTQISRLLHAHEVILEEARAMAREAAKHGDDGTNDLIVSDIIRTNEMQVWFLFMHIAQETM